VFTLQQAGVTLSVVAKVKDSADSCSSNSSCRSSISSSVPTAIIHTGANQFVRVAYRPSQWFHRITVHDSSGDATLLLTLSSYTISSQAAVPGRWLMLVQRMFCVDAASHYFTSNYIPGKSCRLCTVSHGDNTHGTLCSHAV
jgi:hypothetical protein